MEMSQWKDKLSVKNVLYVYACQSHHHPFSHLTPHFFFVVILPLLLLPLLASSGTEFFPLFVIRIYTDLAYLLIHDCK